MSAATLLSICPQSAGAGSVIRQALPFRWRAKALAARFKPHPADTRGRGKVDANRDAQEGRGRDGKRLQSADTRDAIASLLKNRDRCSASLAAIPHFLSRLFPIRRKHGFAGAGKARGADSPKTRRFAGWINKFIAASKPDVVASFLLRIGQPLS